MMIPRTTRKRKAATKAPRSKERLLSISEAAQRIGVSPRSIDRYLQHGHLDYAVLPSGRRMPTERAVEQFIGLALEGRL